MSQQSAAHHGKYVLGFHFIVIPILVFNLGWNVYRLIHDGLTFHGCLSVLVALAIPLGFLYLRLMSLTVQDRVIRLEERLRMERLLPADLKPRIGEFRTRQLIALRFASDAELPVLARKVLEEQLSDQKAIKQMVQNWRADHLRA